MQRTFRRNTRTVSAREWLARQLAGYNQRRLAPRLPTEDFDQELAEENRFRRLEEIFLTSQLRAVCDQAASAPRSSDEFLEWFVALREVGSGQDDPLFPYLADHASLEEFTWFLAQEVAGEAGFDDLTALSQVKLPIRAKLELGRNFWDELGRGNQSGMHGVLLERLTQHLNIAPSLDAVWESLELGNLMVALAVNRRYAYHSLGALGVIELTAPQRSAYVDAGLRRLGIAGHIRQYFALHATLDLRHSEAWNREVLRPIVQAEPRTATAIAEGALLRLGAGARCFVRYRRELHLDSSRLNDVGDTRLRPTA